MVLMPGELVLGSSGLGASPDRGHCIVSLGKTLYSHNWVPANLMLRLTPTMELASHPEGVEIFLVASCYTEKPHSNSFLLVVSKNKLLSDGLLGSHANFTLSFCIDT